MSKQKGSRYERELLHMFWKEQEWSGLRCPGSGSTPLPSPDLLITNKKTYYAIECKAIKGKSKYFSEGEINQLQEFAEAFGAVPLIAIRFDKKGWFFFEPQELKRTKNNFYAMTLNLAQESGRRFESIVGRQNHEPK